MSVKSSSNHCPLQTQINPPLVKHNVFTFTFMYIGAVKKSQAQLFTLIYMHFLGQSQRAVIGGINCTWSFLQNFQMPPVKKIYINSHFSSSTVC